ncbi:MAG TPA: hypothetical protein VMG59_00525 [Phycisphaerae bacterium]|nr:hypothetical protein [Phycisphaerae bacterium]
MNTVKIQYYFLLPQIISLILAMFEGIYSYYVCVFSLVIIFFLWQAIWGRNKTILIVVACLSILISLFYIDIFSDTFHTAYLDIARKYSTPTPQLLFSTRMHILIVSIGFIGNAIGLWLRYREMKRLGMQVDAIRVDEVTK